MATENFTASELERYARHIILPEFGLQGQKRLKSARVLVVGAGGLGSPMLMYLAAAGVGTIGIVDFDRVDSSNLQRQVLFSTVDIGRLKAEVAAERIRAINPHIQVIIHAERLDSNNAPDILQPYDIIADGTDNFATRYLVNDACILFDKINVYGAIFRFDGQVSVFNFPLADGSRGPDYRDLYPHPPPPGSVPSCAEGGVLGVLPGMIGTVQALEVIKCAVGLGDVLSGRLYVLDALSFETRILKFEKNANRQSVEKLIDYDQYCGTVSDSPQEEQQVNADIKSINVHQLKQLLSSSTAVQLIDVREAGEYEIVNLKGELIPMAEMMRSPERIDRERKVVLHCRSGIRSADCIRSLQDQFGFDNLYNLEGGILAWAREIDSDMPVY